MKYTQITSPCTRYLCVVPNKRHGTVGYLFHSGFLANVGQFYYASVKNFDAVSGFTTARFVLYVNKSTGISEYTIISCNFKSSLSALPSLCTCFCVASWRKGEGRES